ALVAVLACTFIVTYIWAELTFKKLVQYEYTNHRPSWEKDGRPYSVLWSPAEPNPELARLSPRWTWRARTISLSWLLSPPNWQFQDPLAKQLMIRYRLMTLFLLISFIGIMIGLAELMMLN